MAFSPSPRQRRALIAAAVAAGTPVAGFCGLTALSHAVFHRSNMATLSEGYHWLKGTNRRANEVVTWDNYVLERAEANARRYSMPQVLDIQYRLMGFHVPIDERTIANTQTYVLNHQHINDRAIVYLHGGSLLEHPDADHWHFIDTVARRTRAEVYVPIYPLAPDHHFQETFDVVRELFQTVCEQYGEDRVTLMGDEAGAGILAGFCEWLAAEGKRQPANLVLISPWVDIELGNPRVQELQPKDVMLSAHGLRKVGRIWADGMDPRDYRLSPVHGNVFGLRNVLVFAGTREILYPDARLFFERVRATGAHAQFVEGRGLHNNFPLYPIPEAERAMDKIVLAVSQG